jgi:hypothetical protein
LAAAIEVGTGNAAATPRNPPAEETEQPGLTVSALSLPDDAEASVGDTVVLE